MASTKDFLDYVLTNLTFLNNEIRYRKMFGEYVVYIDDKPALMICDDTIFVKKLDVIRDVMANSDTGYPYDGAKEHYILDVDDRELTKIVIEKILPELKIPKKRKKN